MIVLGLDTCLNACSVAVVDGGRVLAHRSEVMARGQQERLARVLKTLHFPDIVPAGNKCKSRNIKS